VPVGSNSPANDADELVAATCFWPRRHAPSIENTCEHILTRSALTEHSLAEGYASP
jgi:hypothetical protein